MYPFGPKAYICAISDVYLINKLSKQEPFTHRPLMFDRRFGLENGEEIGPNFSNINGKEWKKRRNLFYNSILKIADSKYMTNHVQNNITNTR